MIYFITVINRILVKMTYFITRIYRILVKMTYFIPGIYRILVKMTYFIPRIYKILVKMTYFIPRIYRTLVKMTLNTGGKFLAGTALCSPKHRVNVGNIMAPPTAVVKGNFNAVEIPIHLLLPQRACLI